MDWVAGLYAIYGLDDVINSLYKKYGLDDVILNIERGSQTRYNIIYWKTVFILRLLFIANFDDVNHVCKMYLDPKWLIISITKVDEFIVQFSFLYNSLPLRKITCVINIPDRQKNRCVYTLYPMPFIIYVCLALWLKPENTPCWPRYVYVYDTFFLHLHSNAIQFAFTFSLWATWTIGPPIVGFYETYIML